MTDLTLLCLYRNVVLAFKSNEWPFVISEIKRVLKDGGCFQCVEFDMRVNIAVIAAHQCSRDSNSDYFFYVLDYYI